MLKANDVLVAGGGDEDVRVVEGFFERLDFVAFHRGLQCTDRIDFSNDHAAALAFE